MIGSELGLPQTVQVCGSVQQVLCKVAEFEIAHGIASFFQRLLISLGICFVPVYLLGGQAFLRTQDLIVSSQATPPKVIRNCSTAYALRLVIFGLFFGWGASGDFWPALISAACYSMGWGLIFVLRRPSSSS